MGREICIVILMVVVVGLTVLGISGLSRILTEEYYATEAPKTPLPPARFKFERINEFSWGWIVIDTKTGKEYLLVQNAGVVDLSPK